MPCYYQPRTIICGFRYWVFTPIHGTMSTPFLRFNFSKVSFLGITSSFQQ
jgi:hypothetical protein